MDGKYLGIGSNKDIDIERDTYLPIIGTNQNMQIKNFRNKRIRIN
jgi:hypothetical protein